MAQFATADELAARLGVTFDAGEETRADTLLTMASGLIQEITGQDIVLVTDDVLIMNGTDTPTIRLPQRPVIEVSQIVVDGDTLDPGDYFRLVARSGFTL